MSNGMNLAQLQAAVYTETNRPDLVAETLQAVFSATLDLHGLDYFAKDIKRASVVFDTPQFIQSFETGSLPFFRKLAYFRKDVPSISQNYELSGNNLPPLNSSIDGALIPQSIARKMIRLIDPDEIFDDYGAEKTDVGYEAGAEFYIKSSTQFQYGLVGWYGWPNCDIANGGTAYSSWIADNYPYAIIYKATSKILTTIGMNDASRKYDMPSDPRDPTFKGGLVQSQILMIITDNLVAGAH